MVDTSSAMNPLLNALSVDVEDFFQVAAYDRLVQFKDWDRYGERVITSTRKILKALADNQVLGTFFVLGWTAEKFPELVSEIHDAGHEIGLHSYQHRLIYNLTPEEFREDTQKSLEILERLTGDKIKCYRAPSFSITEKSLWALDILAELGFEYDSSIFPIYHDRYGIPNCNPEIHQISTKQGLIWEFPPAVYRICGLNFPVSGGGYFRLYPFALTRYFLQKINRELNRPFIFYVHPWELDPDQPVIPGLSMAARFRHHVGINRNERKLEKLLWNFRFGKLSQVIQNRQNRGTGEMRVC